jgi:hypothetical protein
MGWQKEFILTFDRKWQVILIVDRWEEFILTLDT